MVNGALTAHGIGLERKRFSSIDSAYLSSVLRAFRSVVVSVSGQLQYFRNETVNQLCTKLFVK